MRAAFPRVGAALRFAGLGTQTRNWIGNSNSAFPSIPYSLPKKSTTFFGGISHTAKVHVSFTGVQEAKKKREEASAGVAMGRLRGVWQQVKGELEHSPGVRSSHAVSVVNGKLYLIGGEAKAREPVGMAVFTLSGLEHETNGKARWTCVDPSHSPPARNAHAQAAVGQLIYCFGGRKGVEVGEENLADLWSFDTESLSWKEVTASGDVPCPRSYHVACAVGRKLYVFGGCSANGRLADLYSFSPETKVWKRLADPPGLAGRGGATLEGVKDKQGNFHLVVFSGFEGKESKDFLSYSVDSDKWMVHSKPQGLEPRSVCSSFTISSSALGENPNANVGEGEEKQELVVVFGGEVAPSERGHEGAGSFSDEVFVLNSSGEVQTVDATIAETKERINNNDEAAKSREKPEPRGWAYGASLTPNSGIFYGGLTGDDKNPTRLGDTWILTLSQTSN